MSEAIDTKDPATGMTPREAAETIAFKPESADALLASAFSAGVSSTLRWPSGREPAIATLRNFHASRQSAADKLAEAARALLAEMKWDGEGYEVEPGHEFVGNVADALKAYDAGKSQTQGKEG
jgi:hypothetical protein